MTNVVRFPEAMVVSDVTPAEVVRRRLDAQRISSTTFTQPDEVVAWLGAVQAQDYLGALWAVGLRLVDARESDVERALTERKIVRTWPMRGTLHFVAAADARWMTELLAPRQAAAAASRLRSYGIDDAVLSRTRRVLVKNLEGGRQLSRPAVYQVLERAKIATDKQRGLHMLWRLAHDCVLCFGPREGKQQTFVLFDEWLPQAKRLPRDEALAELAQRYFTGHGPATLSDFAWWSGMKLADARLAVRLADERLDKALVGDQCVWFARSTHATLTARTGAHILPAFDEFSVGYTDRTAAVDACHLSHINRGGGMLDPIIVVDGRVVGTWKRRIEDGELIFSSAPFSPLNRSKTRAVQLAVERYARFLELDVRREVRAVRSRGRARRALERSPMRLSSR